MRTSFVAAVAVVVVANGFALVHAAWNRAGTPDAEVTLTEREIAKVAYNRSEDSGVVLNLLWQGPARFELIGNPGVPNWLDKTHLEAMGFDCGMDPGDERADRFYRRQGARKVFVALEYDGVSWKDLEEHRTGTVFNGNLSHLVAIDSDRDSGQLRNRHPDRQHVLILPAVVRVLPQRRDLGRRNYVQGYVEELPSTIHVPLPFSKVLLGGPQKFRVRMKYGTSLEPWVTGVDVVQGN